MQLVSVCGAGLRTRAFAAFSKVLIGSDVANICEHLLVLVMSTGEHLNLLKVLHRSSLSPISRAIAVGCMW
jgi:hypothetical protein